MRASVTSLTKKLISTFFAATLVMGLVPAAAFAANEDNGNDESTNSVISTEASDSERSREISPMEDIQGEPVPTTDDVREGLVDDAPASFNGEDGIDDNATTGDDSNLSIPAATERINEDVMLTTPVAQQETTKNYFLAQTLESTRTIPIVSANLPLDISIVDVEAAEPDAEGEGSDTSEEDGEDSDDPDDADDSATMDDPVDASFTLASSENDSAVSAESTVIGSFTYLGMTFAIEPGGETVALVAVDYNKLPEAFIEKQIIAIPETVTPDGIDYYSVTRIADHAFASLTKENANEDYKGCIALFSDEELLIEAGIDASEVESFLNPESDMIDIDGDGEVDAPSNPLKDCMGILALGIPASVTSIGDEALSGSDTLQYLVVSEDNPSFASYDGALYSADLTNLRLIPEGRVGAIRVAPSATDVSPEAFSHCPSVTTLVADPESGAWNKIQADELRNGSNGVIALVNSTTLDSQISSGFAVTVAMFDILLKTAKHDFAFNAAPVASVAEVVSTLAIGERDVVYADGNEITLTNVELTLSAENNSGGTALFVAGLINQGTAKELTYVSASGSTKTVRSINIQRFTPYSKGVSLRVAPSVSTTRNMDWTTVKAAFKTWYGYEPTSFTCRTCYATVSADLLNNMSSSTSAGTIRFCAECLNKWDLTPNSGAISNRGNSVGQYRAYNFYADCYLDANGGLFGLSPFVNAFGGYNQNWNCVYSTPTRKGYTFDNKFVSTAATGSKVFDRYALITEADNRKYYAQWSAKKAPLVFHWGSGESDPQKSGTLPTGMEAIYDSEMPRYTENAPKRPGYTFLGFYDDSSGGTQYYTAGLGSARVWDKDTTSKVDLYAHWQPNSVYTITLNKNGGAGGTSTVYEWYGRGFYSQSNPSDSTAALTSITAPTRAGYVYGGYAANINNIPSSYWTTLNSSTNAATPMPSSTAFSSDTTLIAMWSNGVYTITLNKNGGTGGTSTVYEKYATGWYDTSNPSSSTTALTSITAPTRPGYTYKGYSISQTATTGTHWTTLNTTTNAATPMPSNTAFSESKTLYAVWTIISYTITWNPNGGNWSGSTTNETTTVDHGKATTAYGTNPARTGYTFLGWGSTSSASSNASYPSSTTSNATYYARWRCTIIWVSNGGNWSGSTDDKTTTVDWGNATTAYGTNPTKTGYAFLGWGSSAAASSNATFPTATTVNTAYYARWRCTMTWNPNGGNWSGSTDNKTTTVDWGNATTAYGTNPTRTGYTFLGWGLSAAASSNTTFQTATTGNCTYYARWRCTITWNPNGGNWSGSTANKTTTVDHGNATTAYGTNPTRTGYTFLGWGSSATASSNVTFTDYTTSNATYYARWRCTITWNPNNGNWSGSTANKTTTVDHGKATTAYGTNPTRTGYTFLGWGSTSSASSNVVSFPSSTTSNATYYARWRCTITWNPNGGNWSGSTDNKTTTVDHGNATTAYGTDPTRTGYTFLGWGNTGIATSNVSFPSSTTSNNTYYARWEAGSFKITLDKQGGTGGTDSFWEIYGDSFRSTDSNGNASSTTITTITAPEMKGYTFDGYYVAPNGGRARILEAPSTGTTISLPSSKKMASSNATLYANWNANVLTVQYEANGGSGTMADSKHTYGTKSSISANGFTAPTGQHFVNWNSKEDGSGDTYSAGNEMTYHSRDNGSNMTLFAQWAPNVLTVQYSTNGGSGTMSNSTHTYGTTSSISACAFAPPTGKHFTGWKRSGTTTTYPVGQDMTNHGFAHGTTITLEAQWDWRTYKIEYDLNGGTNHADNPSSYKYTDNAITLKDPFMIGYDFTGWTGSNGNTASKSVTIAKNSTGDKKYTANWTIHEYKIEYDLDGGTNHPDNPSKYYYTSDAITLKAPSKTGYDFTGWTGSNGSTPQKSVTIGKGSWGNWTCEAHWTPNKYTVSFHPNGGTGGQSEDVKATFDDDMPPISTDKPVYPGYTFNGWWDSPGRSGGNMYYTDACASNGSWDKDKNATLYARWSPKSTFAVNLVDTRLKSGDKTLIYWPERGIVKSKTDDTAAIKGEKVVEPARVSDYEFLGWYDSPEGTAGAKQMIDGDGKLAEDVTGKYLVGTTIWYAWWKHVSCPVNLAASYGTPAFEVASKGRELIEHAVFDAPFKDSLAGGMIEKPVRTGYTFMGYFTEQNPEWGTDKAIEDYSGVRWIDEKGNLTEDNWTMRPAQDKGSITLYAAWQLDDCIVTFDLERRSGAEPVVGTVGNAIWHYGKTVTGPLPVSNNYTFQRNGYDFDGWYYYDKSGQEVRLGAKNGDVTDALEPWLDDRKAVTLYAYWIPRTYKIEFDEKYPVIEGSNVEIPEKLPPITVTYDEKLILPELAFEPYGFDGWYMKGGQYFKGAHMTDGRFTPRGELAFQIKDEDLTIRLEGSWRAPGEYSYTLYVGTPGGTEIVSETPRKYKFTSPVVLGPSLAPERVEGWSFAGWVKVEDDAQARAVIANGGPAADAKTVSGFGPHIFEDMFFVAKWVQNKYRVELLSTSSGDMDRALIPDRLLPTDRLIDHAVEGAALWSEVCDDLGIIRPDLTWSLVYGSSQRAYALPEVSRKGYVFEGWVRQDSSNTTPSKDIVVDPKKQAEVPQDATLVYIPVFSKAVYTIVLDPNGYGLEEKTQEVRYGDTFDFPYPTALNTGACFDIWSYDALLGANAEHIFLQGSSWPVAPVYDEDGNVVEFGLAQLADENNKIRLYAMWSPAYSVDVPLFANMAIDTETGDVAAATNKLTPWNTDETAVYRVESLRYEPMFDDEDRPAFQGADGAYLSVYAGLSLENEKDAPYLLASDKVGFKGEVEYTDIEGKTRKAKPLLIRLGGTTPRLYTRTASKADGTIAEEAADETYGFGSFTAKNPLTLRYGLYFADGVSVDKYAFGKNSGGWELPENDHGNAFTSDDPRNEDYKRGLGWSSNRVDIARLTYTVSMSKAQAE